MHIIVRIAGKIEGHMTNGKVLVMFCVIQRAAQSISLTLFKRGFHFHNSICPKAVLTLNSLRALSYPFLERKYIFALATVFGLHKIVSPQ